MQLLTGPAGSGKTAFILKRLRETLRAGHDCVRLLTPTATMAQHLRNQIAREGFVFRRELIQTLSGFVEAWAGDVPAVPDAVLYLIVEEAARRVNRPEFARVCHMPGFCASLAKTLGELSSAGSNSARLATCLPDAPLGAAFLAVYQDVDRELARRGLAMRGTRLARAAERIASEGLNGISLIWLDGFHALPDPELQVIAAMGRHAAVTLTFESMDSRLAAMGFREDRLPHSRPAPVRALVCAPGIEREVEEIAHRIVDQASAGRPFREIGIIVRAQENYVPILRSTLERFGIPARFYFDEPLQQNAAVRFLSGAVDTMLGGWEHGQTLAVLRLAPRFAASGAMDRLDFAVRRQLPNAGLASLRALVEEGEPLLDLVNSLGAIEEWRAQALGPKEWAGRLSELRKLFRPAAARDGEAQSAAVLRSQAAALDLFGEALEEAAVALDGHGPMPLDRFWPAVKSILRLKPLRLKDERRNVVHVLGAHEARQWVLPVVFVCGMVEKQFPQFHRQDPFFPDAARCRLNDAGIRVRTAAEFEREERALFDSAITRATLLVTLSYPEFDARGERNLPSLYLEDLIVEKQESRAVRPRPRRDRGDRGPVEIRAPELLDFLRRKTTRLSPSQLETFLQCPFQHFARSLLRLEEPPPRPEQRLDFLTQGSIVHDVLSAWWPAQGNIEAQFDLVFERYCADKRIPMRYHTERLRNAMLDDLRAFAADTRWPRAAFQSRMEERFRFALTGGLDISGRIDRLDVAPDGRAYVIDYKYSRAQGIKERHTDESLLQAPLYLLAAERIPGVRPIGMFYLGLKGGILYKGWSESPVAWVEAADLPDNWREDAEEKTLRVVEEMRSGRVEPAPANPDKCRYCDYKDACRVQAAPVAVEIEEVVGM